MDIEIKELNSTARNLSFVVLDDDLKKSVDRTLSDMRRNIVIPGFRRGKVPQKVMRERYGGAISDKVLVDMIRDRVRDFLAERELKTEEQPVLMGVGLDDHGNHEASVVFDVAPTIEVHDVKGKKIVCPTLVVSDEDVDELIEDVTSFHMRWNEVDRAAAVGDMLAVEAQLLSEDGVQPRQDRIHIGSERHHEEIEKGCIGLSAGDETTISMPDPGGKASAELVMRVKADSVMERDAVVLERDAREFVGVETLDDEDFRSNARAALAAKGQELIKDGIYKQVMDHLVDANPFHVPRSVVDRFVVRAMSNVEHVPDPEELYFRIAYSEVPKSEESRWMRVAGGVKEVYILIAVTNGRISDFSDSRQVKAALANAELQFREAGDRQEIDGVLDGFLTVRHALADVLVQESDVEERAFDYLGLRDWFGELTHNMYWGDMIRGSWLPDILRQLEKHPETSADPETSDEPDQSTAQERESVIVDAAGEPIAKE